MRQDLLAKQARFCYNWERMEKINPGPSQDHQ